MSCISSPQNKCLYPPAREREREQLLHCRFLLQPIIEVGLGQNVEVCLHVVMSEATKLGTNNFVLADLSGGEVQRNIQPGNKILLHTQLPHKKGMSNIFRMHEQMDFLVHGDSHLGGHDVVPGVRVVLWIKAEKILVGLIDQLRVKGTELLIRTVVAEIESELSGLDLDGEGGDRRWREIYVSPCLHSEDSEGQDFRAYEQQGSNHQTLGAAGKSLNLCIRATV